MPPPLPLTAPGAGRSGIRSAGTKLRHTWSESAAERKAGDTAAQMTASRGEVSAMACARQASGRSSTCFVAASGWWWTVAAIDDDPPASRFVTAAWLEHPKKRPYILQQWLARPLEQVARAHLSTLRPEEEVWVQQQGRKRQPSSGRCRDLVWH
jgi:hypothetical protein